MPRETSYINTRRKEKDGLKRETKTFKMQRLHSQGSMEHAASLMQPRAPAAVLPAS